MWLLDTNVVSEFPKLRPRRSVLAFVESRPYDRLFLSTVSIAELEFGAFKATSSPKQQELDRWIAHDIRPMFQNRVLEVTEAILLRWFILVKEGRRINRTYSQPDLFLAATALEHNLTLVTRNTRDFAGIPNLSLLNPWESATPQSL